MDDNHDLELLLKSHLPLVIIESHEELRVLDMMKRMTLRLAKPVFKWTLTEGLQRIDLDYPPQKHNSQPSDVLRHIKSVTRPGIYVLVDFHPYLSDPLHVRLLKDLALAYDGLGHTLIFLSHRVDIPPELRKFSARVQLALPGKDELEQLVHAVAKDWARENGGRKVITERFTLDRLVANLSGLTLRDAKRLARTAIYDDGAITQNDLPAIMQAKYELLNKDGVLSFEYDTAKFSDVGGLEKLKAWLGQRKQFFHGDTGAGLDPPKGILLLGVQGCGKSLAAKAVAGTWHVPLLRLDFGALYNKFYGETERNLRESLKTAEVMAPCVLWMDEIEKGLATEETDSGTSRRVLGTLLTWMAERKATVFIVATANDIELLPPELVRKGRFDEIFFVDLPSEEIRRNIFQIHLKKRDLDPLQFDLAQLAQRSAGFSGAEIEQAVVSALYSAHAQEMPLSTEHVLSEIAQTRPLSILMAEKIHHLRTWAAQRTVPCD